MKVWLYYRLSRDEDDELNSLTNQRKIIYEYAVTNGHEVVGESFCTTFLISVSRSKTAKSEGKYQVIKAKYKEIAPKVLPQFPVVVVYHQARHHV